MSVIPEKTLFFQDVVDFGSYDPEHGDDESYWFCMEDYSILEESKLLEKLGYESVEQLENDTSFIPVWKTNITDLKREFLNGNDEYRSYIEDIEEIRQDYTKFQKHHMPWYECSFSQAFNMFFNDGYPGGPVWDEWERYMDDRLRSDFVSWCEKYHIRYEPNAKYLIYTNVARFASYDPAYGKLNDYWFSLKDYQVHKESYIMSDFGYKSIPQIEANGQFIHIFRIDISELKKEFLDSNNKYKPYTIEVEEYMTDYTRFKQNLCPEFECTYSRAFDDLFSPYPLGTKKKHPLWEEWEQYKTRRIIDDFQTWCEENDLNYKKPTEADITAF